MKTTVSTGEAKFLVKKLNFKQKSFHGMQLFVNSSEFKAVNFGFVLMRVEQPP